MLPTDMTDEQRSVWRQFILKTVAEAGGDLGREGRVIAGVTSREEADTEAEEDRLYEEKRARQAAEREAFKVKCHALVERGKMPPKSWSIRELMMFKYEVEELRLPQDHIFMVMLREKKRSGAIR
jgi:hypothetical protein